MGDMASHKRSKSARALALLHRDKSSRTSRGDNPQQETEALAESPGQNGVSTTDPKASSVSPTNKAFRLSHSHSPSMTNLQVTPVGPDGAHLSSSTSARSANHGSCGELYTWQTGSTDGPDQSADLPARPSEKGDELARSAMSIEQSVRTFRLFEILRSGDTTAIFKAIKECAECKAQGTPPLGTGILHLAIQCAEPQVVEYVLSSSADLDINARDRDGNTPLHLAAQLGRVPIVRELLERPDINDSIANYNGQIPLDLARTPEIFQQLQLSRSLFLDSKTKEIKSLIGQGDYENLERLLVEPRVEGLLDINSLDLVTDRTTVISGGTLLHEAARRKDTKLVQILLMHGADPFRRDRKGKLPQDVTKDDRTRAIVKKSPAAVIAQRGIQEKAILGSSAGQGSGGRPGSGETALVGKDAREMKGYLKKWTNYTSGYKLRWFVLEDGVMSYYKHQDDAGSACRGAINMRIATLHMDAQDKTRFEIQGKSSVKYHLKANHIVEAKRWFWALNNAIQWAKDEAKEDDRRRTRNAESLRQAKMEQFDKQGLDSQSDSCSLVGKPNGKTLAPSSSLGIPSHTGSRLSLQTSRESAQGEDDSTSGPYESTFSPSDSNRLPTLVTTSNPVEGDLEDDDYGDYASSQEMQPSNKDAFNITAESVKLQLEVLSNVSAALQEEKLSSPQTPLSEPSIDQALTTYQRGVSNLTSLVADLLKISKDRDAYWQYRLDREADARKMWEDSMARVAQEHEELQSRIGESEEKRKKTKKALKEVLEHPSASTSRPISRRLSHVQIQDALEAVVEAGSETPPCLDQELARKRSIITELTKFSDSESDADEEFFDAVDAGEVEVIEVRRGKPVEAAEAISDLRTLKYQEIAHSFKGYEDPVRVRLKMDADNRPKISLWAILKSMIGKDMTKMTLPVSFNEPTSLLQRVAEDMEYTDLLDHAADLQDSMERMVYVAAFAASEYASTIGRVAKPFNPLLGETFEYVRPDKGYRFFIEQVSHHPPIGAAWAESPKWDYYGESAVRSKFYGKSFDINPLGTWFLRLRPVSGGEELYTWKKVTSSVVGIITGNPTVDNYGPMEIKNWATGEVCMLDFKPRGWKASSAYHVSGKVMDKEGFTKWSIGGRWNDKVYARHTPGYQDSVTPPSEDLPRQQGSTQAFLVWQCNTRPTGIPFNLTPFVITLNAIPDNLKHHLPPTDTRLRPDQRAMEDGEYDFAATEKHRVEEKQRAKRREREAKGEEFEPKWFTRGKCEITGEEYWVYNGRYWRCRDAGDWSVCEDIF
ncbi:oxysterol-binding protein [Histoplasma capsulatum var. duboisii H88]|uniref:Oxysterol-binding protein n=1 Tax=Ajellomyces capsulatus (strain H88) TaxID=544711 RepID=A0A8A1LVK0_AJEC8|nr:oxysterol-binding protein [Histoplasma capsulatum var. duboisii H88]